MSDFMPGNYDAWKLASGYEDEEECICHRTPGGRRTITYKCMVHGEGPDPDDAYDRMRDERDDPEPPDCADDYRDDAGEDC
jgi:hypothetical protein